MFYKTELPAPFPSRRAPAAPMCVRKTLWRTRPSFSRHRATPGCRGARAQSQPPHNSNPTLGAFISTLEEPHRALRPGLSLKTTHGGARRSTWNKFSPPGSGVARAQTHNPFHTQTTKTSNLKSSCSRVRSLPDLSATRISSPLQSLVASARLSEERHQTRAATHENFHSKQKPSSIPPLPALKPQTSVSGTLVWS